jgi:hypothetical protein
MSVTESPLSKWRAAVAECDDEGAILSRLGSGSFAVLWVGKRAGLRSSSVCRDCLALLAGLRLGGMLTPGSRFREIEALSAKV